MKASQESTGRISRTDHLGRNAAVAAIGVLGALGIIAAVNNSAEARPTSVTSTTFPPEPGNTLSGHGSESFMLNPATGVPLRVVFNCINPAEPSLGEPCEVVIDLNGKQHRENGGADGGIFSVDGPFSAKPLYGHIETGGTDANWTIGTNASNISPSQK